MRNLTLSGAFFPPFPTFHASFNAPLPRSSSRSHPAIIGFRTLELRKHNNLRFRGNCDSGGVLTLSPFPDIETEYSAVPSNPASIQTQRLTNMSSFSILIGISDMSPKYLQNIPNISPTYSRVVPLLLTNGPHKHFHFPQRVHPLSNNHSFSFLPEPKK